MRPSRTPSNKFSRIQNDIGVPEHEYLFKGTSQLPDAGLGLFTIIDIYRDEKVAVFEGEVLTERQIALRVRKGLDKYFISLLDGGVLDSMNSTCLAKFSNDVKGTGTTNFRNNLRIELDDRNNVCLSATRKIRAGEELFCSYGKRYWKKHLGR